MQEQRPPLRRPITLLLAICVATLAAPPKLAATPFVNETVGADARVSSISLKVDAEGNPHISYYDFSARDLKYATKVFGRWTIETVDADGDVGLTNSLALDTNGIPFIIYLDETNRTLKYASRSGGRWTLETVTDIDGVVSVVTVNALSLAMTWRNRAHLVYIDLGGLRTRLYSRSRDAWDSGFDLWSRKDPIGPDPDSDLGDPSLAVGSDQRSYLSYHDITNNTLKYGNDRLGWLVETVDLNAGRFCSLALDAENTPHIAYGGSRLRYAVHQNVGVDWLIEDVSDDDPSSTSIAVDADGTPHIGYTDFANDLKYASKVAGKLGPEWVIETVDAGGSRGLSLALDAEGNPHISYIDTGDPFHLKYTDASLHLADPLGGDLWAVGSQHTVGWDGTGPVDVDLSQDGGLTYTKVASTTSGRTTTFIVPSMVTEAARVRVSRLSPVSTSASPGFLSVAPDLVSPYWFRTVDATGNVGLFTSLALDVQGNPRISYYDSTSGSLKYASKVGVGWAIDTVDTGGNVGLHTSLALDGQGIPHISYYDATNGDLKYARRTGAGTSNAWLIETVDAGGDVGRYTSLVLDENGYPHISYYDVMNGDLKYASRAVSGTGWIIETVDAGGDVGRHASLALDDTGDPHISYFDFTSGDLKYATRSGAGTGSAWSYEMVDPGGNVGGQSSIAVYGGGTGLRVGISYYDVGNGHLKFALKSATGWTVETIDAAGDVGGHTSIRMQAGGNPQISYYDFTNGDLRFTRKTGSFWRIETLDAGGNVGAYSALALDAQGRAHFSYYAVSSGDLKYASAAVEVAEPAPGVIWPVGASRAVRWSGTGRVDLYLSPDGGNSWQLLQPGILGGEFRLEVPHVPTHFAKLKLERAVPRSVAVSAGLFTIQTSITLLSFNAQSSLPSERGAVLNWRTDPGPEDLAGYRIDRARTREDWRTLVALTREASYYDPEGGPGSRYRLTAVNGFGEALVLGEVSLAPARPLAAWPIPYHGGELTVSFATFGGLGGGKAQAKVELFDVAGRLVRILARDEFPAGYYSAPWDGRDYRGERVGNGVYFIRAHSFDHDELLKIVVLR